MIVTRGVVILRQVYAPGCALMIYKPELAEKILDFLKKELGELHEHLTCCRHEPNLESKTQVINICPGCDRRYRELYEGFSTISLWEILAQSKTFSFPNYNGIEMTIHDACPTRTEERVHLTIRKLLERMNIKVVEPTNTRTKSVCCGDSFYRALPKEQTKDQIDKAKGQMKKRAKEMPCDNVVVYCVSCIKSMHIGGKKPRYIIDLLFDENTSLGTIEPDAWHNELQGFIDAH